MGLVHLYCGDGKGKTTASIGLAIRAAGSGMKILFAQFLKDCTSCELNIIKNIPNFTVLCSQKNFDFYTLLSDTEKLHAKNEYISIFNQVKSIYKNYDMIILDEIIHAVNLNIISTQELLDFIDNAKDKSETILTGRNPTFIISEACDYVSEIFNMKHPYEQGIIARKGIEY